MVAHHMISKILGSIAETTPEVQQRVGLAANRPANGVAHEGEEAFVKLRVKLRGETKQNMGWGITKVELVQGSILANLLFSKGFAAPYLVQYPRISITSVRAAAIALLKIIKPEFRRPKP